MLVVLGAVPLTSGTAAAGAGPARSVRYLGRTFTIPRGWRVIDLAAHPRQCVRFDRHVLYLGAPGRVQDCPAGLVGATEAMLVQPSARRAVPRAVDYPVDRMITVVTRRITVTASYSSDRAQIGEIKAAARQVASAARDAVSQAQALGFGPGSPIYYDMEAYPASRGSQVPRFLTAWTRELHTLQYASGVYSNSLSGISDLASNYANPSYAMPDIIYDALWNGAANTLDPVVPAADWAQHQRIHQRPTGGSGRRSASRATAGRRCARCPWAGWAAGRPRWRRPTGCPAGVR